MYNSENFKRSDVDEKENVPSLFTHMLVTEEDENCSFSLRHVILETMLNKLEGLSFTDFSLSKLLASGVDLSGLSISKDCRLGYDSEIEAFNNHLIEIRDSLFNSVN